MSARTGRATSGRVGVLAAALLVPAGPAAAFHEQGVANCTGCHVSHPGEGGSGALIGPSADTGALIAESPSDVCLLCHADSLGAVLGSDPLAPPPERGPGNFVFLLEDNLNDAPGGVTDPIPGDAGGHNLVAPGHGLGPDPRHPTAPGGSYPSNQLGCTSCHDPHGNDNYRMLYGAGQVPAGGAPFTNPAPEAAGIPLGGPPEYVGHHVAYRSGMSAWCGNCHGRYHDPGSGSDFAHETDRALGAEISQRYAAYAGDANPDDGFPSSAYLMDVPFEDPSSTTSSTAGPEPFSRLMCSSCHRAHASSAPAAGRWDFGVELLREDGRESGSWPIPDPYGDPGQGPLCAKCHDTTPGAEDPLGILREWREGDRYR